MAIPLKAHHLKRYKDVAQLLFKYGQFDIVKSAGLSEIIRVDHDQRQNGNGEAPGAAVADTTGISTAREDELSADLEHLGPAFVRLGQLLSARPDLLPLPYLPALAHLHEDVAPLPIAEVEALLAKELGVPVTQAFRSIEALPIASSSLDQTHRAVLKNGSPAVVKLQHPRVAEQIYDDLGALDEMVQIYEQARPKDGYDLRTMLEQLRNMLVAELDYRQEAHNLRTLKEILKGFPGMVVPDPVRQYSSARVLTTTFAPAQKLDKIKASGLLRNELTSLAEQIFSAYLRQILVDGFVHSDPGVETLLLTRDGRIELFNPGPVIRITPGLRVKLLQLLLSVNEGRAEHVLELLNNLSGSPEEADDVGFARSVLDLVAVHKDADAETLEIGKTLQGLAQAAMKFGRKLPFEIAVVGTVLLNVDSIVHMLDPNFDTRAYINRHVSPMMSKHVRGSLSPAHIYHTLLESIELFEKLPGKVTKILDAVAKNEFKVTVHAIDENILISGFQKIANRITVGLILASLVMGAALLMRVPTKFSIWGYPGLAIICFLLAGGCGFGLVLEILISDFRSHS